MSNRDKRNLKVVKGAHPVQENHEHRERNTKAVTWAHDVKKITLALDGKNVSISSRDLDYTPSGLKVVKALIFKGHECLSPTSGKSSRQWVEKHNLLYTGRPRKPLNLRVLT